MKSWNVEFLVRGIVRVRVCADNADEAFDEASAIINSDDVIVDVLQNGRDGFESHPLAEIEWEVVGDRAAMRHMRVER